MKARETRYKLICDTCGKDSGWVGEPDIIQGQLNPKLFPGWIDGFDVSGGGQGGFGAHYKDFCCMECLMKGIEDYHLPFKEE